MTFNMRAKLKSDIWSVQKQSIKMILKIMCFVKRNETDFLRNILLRSRSTYR